MDLIDNFVSTGISTLTGSRSSKSERSVNFVGSNVDIPVVYGEEIIPAIWVGFTKPGDGYYDFYGLAVFCHAPIELIEWVEVNGNRNSPAVEWTNDHGLENLNADFGYSYKAQKNGNNHRPLWIDEGEDWPPADAPDGVVRIGGGLVFAEFGFNVGKGFISSIPNVRIKVRGRNCIFDPRVDATPDQLVSSYNSDFTTGSTESACTNPALIRADYLTNKHYGKGLNWDQINIPELINAANVCDTPVPDGDAGNIPLFSFNGRIDTAEKIDSNLNKIDLHFRNHSPYHNGQFGFVIRDDYPTPDTLLVSWIHEFGDNNFGDKSKRYNQCIITYPEPAYDLEANQVIWPALDSQTYIEYLAADGEELKIEIELDHFRNRYQAIDYAEAIVRESRLQKSTKITVKYAALKYQSGDVLDIPLKGIGMTRMRIIKATTRNDFLIDWELREHSNDAYPWSTKTAIPLPANDGVSPISLLAPVNLVFTPDETNEHTSGVLAWDSLGNPLISAYKITITNIDTGRIHANLEVSELFVDIPNIPAGTYSFSVRGLTSIFNGPEALIAVSIITPFISEIKGLELTTGGVEFADADCWFKWESPENAAFTVLEYRVQIIDIQSDLVVFEDRTRENSYKFTYQENLKSGLNRQFKIRVFAQGKYGQDNLDTGAAILVVSNPEPVLFNAVSFKSSIDSVTVSFDLEDEVDIKQVRFWLGIESGFEFQSSVKSFDVVGNQATLSGLESNTAYYLRYTVKDVFHSDDETGVVSSEFTVVTSVDAQIEFNNALTRAQLSADRLALQTIIEVGQANTDRQSINSSLLNIAALKETALTHIADIKQLQLDTTQLGSTVLNFKNTSDNQATVLQSLTTTTQQSTADISQLKIASVDQALNFENMSLELDGLESVISSLQTVTGDYASTLSSINLELDGVTTNITNLQTVTVSNAESLTTLTASNSSITSAITSLQTVTASNATVLSSVQTEQTTAGLILDTLSANGSTKATAGLYVDTGGAIAGVFIGSNETSSDIVFKADSFSFKTDSGTASPFSLTEDNEIKFNGEIDIDDGRVVISESSIGINTDFYKMSIDTEGLTFNSSDVKGLYIKSESTALAAHSSGQNTAEFFNSFTASNNATCVTVQSVKNGLTITAEERAITISRGKEIAYIEETSLTTFPSYWSANNTKDGGWHVISAPDGLWVCNGNSGWINLLTGGAKAPGDAI